MINRWPDEQLTDRLRVLRATLRQSLHQFDSARADLEQVLSSSSDNQQRIQARLTLANLELVQGRYTEAGRNCQALQSDYPGLIAKSCLASVQARTADPQKAYRNLAQQLAEATGRQPADSNWSRPLLPADEPPVVVGFLAPRCLGKGRPALGCVSVAALGSVPANIG